MNSFGRIFRINILGESHGKKIGVLIDGCPPGISIIEDDFLRDLQRRKPGAKGTTTRIEEDIPQFETGIKKFVTTGAPILISFENKNIISSDYSDFDIKPRPGHSDFVSMMKFKNHSDLSGGGHFSGRLTLGLVAAGVIAKRILKNIAIEAKLIEAGGIKDIDSAVEKALAEKDSIGGLIECRISNIPIGIGEPFFDSLESIISHIIFSIPAIKGIEFGSGFKSAEMYGSEHNDVFIDKSGKTKTNNAGGINGGISNGNEIVFRVAVKPTSSIGKEQTTINFDTGKTETLSVKGRHDACIALRIPVIVEAAAAIALADLTLIQKIND